MYIILFICQLNIEEQRLLTSIYFNHFLFLNNLAKLKISNICHFLLHTCIQDNYKQSLSSLDQLLSQNSWPQQLHAANLKEKSFFSQWNQSSHLCPIYNPREKDLRYKLHQKTHLFLIQILAIILLLIHQWRTPHYPWTILLSFFQIFN